MGVNALYYQAFTDFVTGAGTARMLQVARRGDAPACKMPWDAVVRRTQARLTQLASNQHYRDCFRCRRRMRRISEMPASVSCAPWLDGTTSSDSTPSKWALR